MLIIVVTPARAESGATIRLNPPGERRAGFEVVGLESAAAAALARAEFGLDRWSALFSVFVVPANSPIAKSQSPMLGTHRVESGVLRFQPRFPLEPGLVYRAQFDPAQLPTAQGATEGSPVVVAEFSLPKKPVTSTTHVVAVYPTRDTLPENLLKFYLHFSAPMSRGMAFRHIHLRDAAGKDVQLAFVEAVGELWDPNFQRLTLLFDPGRIKKGLKPREELGPILREGESYTLVIDRGWLDATGEPLQAEYRKTFRAGPTDEHTPDPASWTIMAPDAGTRRTMTIAFPEPLDSAMLLRVIAIHDSAGHTVPGEVAIDGHETLWKFTPERPWLAGQYHVKIDKDLEDLTGNSVGRPFEVDVFEKVERKPVADTVSLPFRIGPPDR
jgi:hypothetical protein